MITLVTDMESGEVDFEPSTEREQITEVINKYGHFPCQYLRGREFRINLYTSLTECLTNN